MYLSLESQIEEQIHMGMEYREAQSKSHMKVACFGKNKCAKTLEPHYNVPRYSAILVTTLFLLGSQMIFKKYLWGSADVNSPIFAHIRMINYLIL